MKKLYYLIVLTLILGLVLTGCLLSNVGQVPTTGQSGIAYLTKGGDPLPELVGQWHFNGNAFDSSGKGYDGTVYGAEYDNGRFGEALRFDGDDDYVQLPASSTILNTDTFTIEAWFKTSMNHPVEGAEGRLITFYKSATASTALSLYVGEDHIGFLYYNGTAHVWMKFTVNYHDDVWHHIAVTYDTTTYNLYYDGTKVESWDDNFGWFGACPASLGDYISSERFFNGIIDEVRIWNIALTANQIQQSKESPLPVIVTTSRSVPDSVEVNVEQAWDITITVCNYDDFNDPTDVVVVQGGIGADLDITEVNDTVVNYPMDKKDEEIVGDVTLIKRGGKMGATIVKWEIDTLSISECLPLDLKVQTGLNPKGMQEFTSTGLHDLDGGFSATYTYLGDEYKTPETDPLTVDVE